MRTKKTRRWLMKNIVSGGRCSYCGKELTKKGDTTLDHVYPASRGGSNKYENMLISCARCNGLKGDMTLKTFRKKYVGKGKKFYFESGEPITILGDRPMIKESSHKQNETIREQLRKAGLLK